MKHTLLLILLIAFIGEIWGQAPLSATIDAGDVRCYGDSTGYISVLPQGGTSPYIFALDSGEFTTNTTFSKLSQGAYTVYVGDITFDTISLNVQIDEPTPLRLTIDQLKGESCHRDQSGSIDFRGLGRIGTYQYAIDNTAFSNSNVFKNLSAGVHLLRIQDANTCETDSSVLVGTPSPIDGFVTVIEEVRCAGEMNGRIRISAVGGWGNYQYALNGSSLQENATFSNLPGGDYTAFIRDDSSCVGAIPFLLEEPAPVSYEVEIDSLACFGDQNGAIRLIGIGGRPPYSFAFNSNPFSFRDLYGGLGPGTYEFQVRDLSNCPATPDSVTLIEPAELTVALSGVDVLCKGENTGELTAVISGGTAPYTYFWDGKLGLDQLTLSNTSAGPHFFVAEDQNGCSLTDTISISEPRTRIQLELRSVLDTECERPEGQIEVAAVGGSGSPVYTWSPTGLGDAPNLFDLLPGTYTAFATDSLGCADSLSVVVETTPIPQVDFLTSPSLENPIRITEARVLFMADVQDGYTYQWDFGDGKGQAEGLQVSYTFDSIGTFTVSLEVADRVGACPITIQRELTILPVEKLYIPNAFSPNQDGTNDVFQVQGEEVSSLQLAIFNRWGQRVGQLNSPTDVWSGDNSQGEPLPPGVYPYQAYIQYESGYISRRGGTITLIR